MAAGGGGGGGGGEGGGRWERWQGYKIYIYIKFMAETSTVSMQICLLRWAI